MKTCPYCAEEIRDVAAVCDNCGHDFAAGERQQESTRSLKGKIFQRRVIPLLALAIIAALYLLRHDKSRSPGTVSQSGTPSGARLRAPHIILIASASAIEVQPGTVERIDWTVPADQPNCHLTGRIEVTSGGNKEIQVLVTTADAYKNLANGHSATAYLRRDKATIVNLDIRLNMPGHMVLAIGDTVSAVTGKHVQLSDVKATCT